MAVLFWFCLLQRSRKMIFFLLQISLSPFPTKHTQLIEIEPRKKKPETRLNFDFGVSSSIPPALIPLFHHPRLLPSPHTHCKGGWRGIRQKKGSGVYTGSSMLDLRKRGQHKSSAWKRRLEWWHQFFLWLVFLTALWRLLESQWVRGNRSLTSEERKLTRLKRC